MRYLTQNIPGTGGTLKSRYEDFVVEEVPLYEPSGEGEHVYFQIEKRGIPTFEALRRVARVLHVRPRDIGYAGLKDARAVTRQVLSVAGVSEAQVQSLCVPALDITWVSRHRNKLKLGHLKGNRFTIRVGDVDEPAVDAARQVMAVLERRGAPNYFGKQRFGSKGDTHVPGRCMIKGDWEGAVRAVLGGPTPSETDQTRQARTLFEEGQLQQALDAFPRMFRTECHLLRVLLDSDCDWTRAFRAIPRELKRLFLSAYQSHLFNPIVEERLDHLDELWPGDLAYKHVNGACFTVTDPAAEAERLQAIEVSPSGPLYGRKLKFAEGRQGDLERQRLEQEGLTLDDFASPQARSIRGARRPLRFPVRDVDVGFDEGLLLSFFLPKGCYATTVLAEVMKAGDG